jgi:hypothetical protein
MIKEIYIIKGLKSEAYDSFRNRMLKLCEEVLDQYNPEKLKISITLKSPPALSIIPFKKKTVAVISLIRKKGAVPDLLTGTEGYIGGYEVEEAIPVRYKRSWRDGEPTPGDCLLTLFHSKPGLDRETFIHRWHNGHTPLSLEIHPLWNYNRNVVKKTLSEKSLWFDGIVEEQFQKPADLLNPLVFFGPPLKVPLHMYKVWMDTKSFIDMKRIETYLATEIHIKS